MTRVAFLLERVSVSIGVAVAWLGIPAMIGLAALQPIARWLGWESGAPFSEASTFAFLALTMTSFGYAYAQGAHVRLDIFSKRFALRANAAIELAGTTLVLLPLCVAIVADGIDSAWRSFQQGERWADTAWALQWSVRAWVPLGFLLLMCAGLASALRAILALAKK